MAKTAAPRKLAALLAGLGLQCRAVTPAPGSDVLLGSYLAFFGALGGWRGCIYIYIRYIHTYLHTYIRTYICMWIIGKWIGTLHLPQSYSGKVLRKSWMSLSRLHQVLRSSTLWGDLMRSRITSSYEQNPEKRPNLLKFSAAFDAVLRMRRRHGGTLQLLNSLVYQATMGEFTTRGILECQEVAKEIMQFRWFINNSDYFSEILGTLCSNHHLTLLAWAELLWKESPLVWGVGCATESPFRWTWQTWHAFPQEHVQAKTTRLHGFLHFTKAVVFAGSKPLPNS